MFRRNQERPFVFAFRLNFSFLCISRLGVVVVIVTGFDTKVIEYCVSFLFGSNVCSGAQNKCVNDCGTYLPFCFIFVATSIVYSPCPIVLFAISTMMWPPSYCARSTVMRP